MSREGSPPRTFHVSNIMCHVSFFMFHVSYVLCLVSYVSCHVSHVFLFLCQQNCEASRWRVTLSG